MKVLIHGKRFGVRFEGKCECGCKFEAERGEVILTADKPDFGICIYDARCPECGTLTPVSFQQ